MMKSRQDSKGNEMRQPVAGTYEIKPEGQTNRHMGSYYFSIINSKPGLSFVAPTVTKATGKAPTFKMECSLCRWVDTNDLVQVS